MSLLLIAVTLAGCYRSAPVSGSPEPGMRLMIGLTREGTERLENDIGRDVVRLEAEAAATNTESWDVRLLHTYDTRGMERSWARETISIPRSWITTVEHRELDRRRSAIAAAAITAAVVLGGRAFLKRFFSGEDNGGPPVPPQ